MYIVGMRSLLGYGLLLHPGEDWILDFVDWFLAGW
jgi:hypothetical protein